MTVEIDDSGTGDLIGSAFILFWRRETNELVTREIPLDLYKSPDFNLLTKNYIRDQFIEVFKELNMKKTEDIYLCTGPCFDHAREWLKAEGYNLNDAKIEGYLQDKVEETYLQHIVNEYNVPAKILTAESGKDRFFALFHWVSQDFPRREFYVKSGFDKWSTKWRDEAEIEWMRKMVKTEEIYPHHYENRHYNDHKIVPPPIQSEDSKPKASKPKKKFIKRKFSSKKPRPPHKKSKKSSHSHSKKKQYSSTDPNPQKKLY